MLVEMGEERVVSEVLQARSIISHDVSRSWEVEVYLAVAVLSLEETGIVAQVGRDGFAGDSAFLHAREGRSVVAAISDGGIPDVVSGGHHSRLSDEASML